MSEYLLEMRNIVKTFPGVKALSNAQLQLRAGEVHALLGENGAGKSTLIKVLGGIWKPDSGEILINGKRVEIDGVATARELGVSIIHQELMLVPELSVAENIFMGRELGAGVFADIKEMEKRAQSLIDLTHVPFKATDKVRSLSIANQQMVEIIRAISFGAKIVVMDEPTSSLSDREVEVLFASIKELKSQNIGIIYISHRISEFDEIADRITVMRDGEYINTVETKKTNRDELVAMMVGRELTSYYVKNSKPQNDVVLEVKNLSDSKMVKDVSFTLRKGEVLGFAGLVGAGRSEVMKCIFGLSKKTKGSIFVDGQEVSISGVKDALRYGIGLVPESRKTEGIFSVKDIRFNSSIVVLKDFIKGISVNYGKENEIVSRFCEKMSVKASSYEQRIGQLSGGNQQKVIVARWLATNPHILILDEPTRGIDVSAKTEIYGIINDLAKEGVSIILITSELPEVINMSDRIVVMNNGYVADIISDDFTQEHIMRLATQDMA